MGAHLLLTRYNAIDSAVTGWAINPVAASAIVRLPKLQGERLTKEDMRMAVKVYRMLKQGDDLEMISDYFNKKSISFLHSPH